MVHPDHQYDPTVIPQMIQPILDGRCDAVFGSRMLGGRPLEGGMPKWKYLANIFLTAVENATFYMYLTEYHSGLRAYSRRYLETVAFMANSDDFVFDSEIIAQGVLHGMRIREIPIETRYFQEASPDRYGAVDRLRPVDPQDAGQVQAAQEGHPEVRDVQLTGWLNLFHSVRPATRYPARRRGFFTPFCASLLSACGTPHRLPIRACNSTHSISFSFESRVLKHPSAPAAFRRPRRDVASTVPARIGSLARCGKRLNPRGFAVGRIPCRPTIPHRIVRVRIL